MNENNESSNVVDNSAILELIQSIQDKMNNNTNEDKFNSDNYNENIDTYTQNSNTDTSNNTENIINNKNSENNQNSKSFNLSDISSILNNFDISGILNLLSTTNKNTNNENNSNFNFDKIDPKILEKITKVIMSMSRNDPRKDLLNSLKPFLRKTRQDKIGEYISILNIINAIQIFYDKGSDENVKI